MATTEFWQRLSASVSSIERDVPLAPEVSRYTRGTAKFWMAFDVAIIVSAATAATMYEFKTGLIDVAVQFWSGTLFWNNPTSNLVLLVAIFTMSLILTSKRLHLYTPTRISSALNEQRLSLQACLTAGLVLIGTLYLLKEFSVPRSVVLLMVGLVSVSLGVRRLLYRIVLYHRYDRGVGTRNVLVVGTGPEAHALRHHLESIRHLGYTFKGFVELSDSGSANTNRNSDVVGSFDTLFHRARTLFVDEIFFTSPCDHGLMQNALELARVQGVDLRIIPDMYDGLAWNSPIEYIGLFPTIPLHRGHVPELALIFKRGFDVLFSILFLVVFSPLLLLIAIAVKLDSPGPALYRSGADRQEGPRIPLHEVPHHGGECR